MYTLRFLQSSLVTKASNISSRPLLTNFNKSLNKITIRSCTNTVRTQNVWHLNDISVPLRRSFLNYIENEVFKNSDL